MLCLRIVLALAAVVIAAHGERAVLECTADTWAAPGEASPRGGSRELVLDGDGGAAVLRFRFAAVAGWRVERAVLLLHVRAGPAPSRLRVAVVEAPWSESRATFAAADEGRAWLAPAGDLRELMARQSRASAVREYGEGWMEVELPAAAATALAEGRVSGLALAAEGGGRVVLDARETIGQAPYLLVQGRSGASRRMP